MITGSMDRTLVDLELDEANAGYPVESEDGITALAPRRMAPYA